MSATKVILYDDTCPLCCWYTAKFVRHGLLQEENRRAFSQLKESDLSAPVDWERSRDEIPLLDLGGGTTLYGIDSLGYLLGRKLPFVPRCLRVAPIRWFFTQLYRLVSYNRRVIVGKSAAPVVGIDCAPHFNAFYRYLYIALALGVGGTGLALFSALYLPLWAGCSLLAALLLLFSRAYWLSGETAADYAGSLATAVLVGGVLALPAVWWPGGAVFFGSLAGVVMGRMVWLRVKALPERCL